MRAELLAWLADRMVAIGPEVLFFVCLLETAIFAGLVLPVGATIAFGAMLASRGYMDPMHVASAALLGALIGDQLGFVVGRWFVRAARPARGRVARVWQAALAQTERLVRRRGLTGITVARAVPFVRTLMPWFAGRSGMGWPRFLLFDVLGILLWGTIYVGGGFAAGVGWHQVADRYGELAGLVLLALIGLGLLAATRQLTVRARRTRARRRAGAPDGDGVGDELLDAIVFAGDEDETN